MFDVNQPAPKWRQRSKLIGTKFDGRPSTGYCSHFLYAQQFSTLVLRKPSTQWFNRSGPRPYPEQGLRVFRAGGCGLSVELERLRDCI